MNALEEISMVRRIEDSSIGQSINLVDKSMDTSITRGLALQLKVVVPFLHGFRSAARFFPRLKATTACKAGKQQGRKTCK